jgi:hypothetical protein
MRQCVECAIGLLAAGIMAAVPLSAAANTGVDAPVCFMILDQMTIEAGSYDCVLEVEAYEMNGGQGPYYVNFKVTDGELLCDALKDNYLAGYGLIYGEITISNPFFPAQPFPLNLISGDDPACRF